MEISVFGLGYVGSVAAACLASRGHSIVGVDVFAEKVDRMNAGEAQISEPGLDALIAEQVAAGRLRATTDAAEAVAATSVSFICVGTPSAPDGGIDLRYVDLVADEIARAINKKAGTGVHSLILRSTMVPGSSRRYAEGVFAEVIGSGRAALYFYPEFLRQGTAIADFLDPSAAVVGCADPQASIGSLGELLDPGITQLGYEAAELVKYACNAFHATKVAFANEIGRVAKRFDVDGREVMAALCEDTRLNISSYYMRPGNPFGGSCLPKDVAALNSMAGAAGVEVPMLASVLESNACHVEHLYQLIRSRGVQDVVILGLSFKRDTDDLRGSAMVEVASRLFSDGCRLRIYDPWLNLDKMIGASKTLMEEKLPSLPDILKEDCASALGEKGVVVVANRSVDLVDLRAALKPEHSILDINGWSEIAGLGVSAEGICW